MQLSVAGENGLSTADDNRIDHRPKLVDEVVLDQGRNELRASEDHEVSSAVALEIGDRVDADDRRTLPWEWRLECFGNDILRALIDWIGNDGLVLGCVRPEGGEVLVSSPAVQKGISRRDGFGHLLLEER